MIKNNRAVLLDIAKYTIKNLLPEKLLTKELKKLNTSKFKRIAVFGIGKAAKTMSQATVSYLKKVNPENKPSIALADKGHPLPTKQGIKNTEKIIKLAESLTKDDLAIVLLSGGGSAMFVNPIKGITLEEKIELTKKLLKSGANIKEINTVRKHLSQVKGGQLAQYLYPATTICYAISDVIGNDLSIIASGPLTPDPSTLENALKILKKYKITAPKSIQETPKSSEKYFKNVKIKIIADQSSSAKLAAERARQLKLKTKIVSTKLSGESKKVAEKFIKSKIKNTLLIASGETTVTIKGNGFGGRNQEFVLAALPHLRPNQTLLSIGTDGIDGICPEKIAGAIADTETLKIAKKLKLNPLDYLKNNDSYTFFKKTSGNIKTGATGTNVGDLVLLMS